MKSKFQNLNFGSLAMLSKDQQRKVKGGGYGGSGGGGSASCSQKSCTWTTGTDTTSVFYTGVCSASGSGTTSSPCFYVCPGSGTCY